jgi:tetratricopeptide (TPR) repeat protein
LSLAALHDLKAAYAALAAAGMMDPARRADLEIKFGPFPTGRLLYAIATNDSGAEAADYRGQLAKLESAARRSQDGIELIKPPLAVALARSGRAEEAETALAGMPDDNDPALRARALAAAFAGKRGESDTLFARAVARTPSLPAGHLMWAEALLARGAWASAAKQARLASGKGPRWAEPLKLWGDALLVGRQPRKAVAKYAAAAERAPRWGKLHLKWANALWMSGQRKEAVAKLREAAGMDLSTNDRQLLSTMWNNARDRLAHKA